MERGAEHGAVAPGGRHHGVGANRPGPGHRHPAGGASAARVRDRARGGVWSSVDSNGHRRRRRDSACPVGAPDVGPITRRVTRPPCGSASLIYRPRLGSRRRSRSAQLRHWEVPDIIGRQSQPVREAGGGDGSIHKVQGDSTTSILADKVASLPCNLSGDRDYIDRVEKRSGIRFLSAAHARHHLCDRQSGAAGYTEPAQIADPTAGVLTTT